ncbi:MAG: RNA polymerase sigma factor [Patescibacteria group bacterium]|jgi:RNA polymerase sigma-70 factor (ECF subfamily)
MTLPPARIETPGELIDKARKGDAKAFGVIYELWVDNIYRFTYLKTKDEDVAEDLTAEVFLKAYKGLKTYQPRTEVKFSTWLFAIARNAIIDYYRTTRQSLSLEDLPEIASLESVDLYQEQTGVQEALLRIKPEYRQVLTLRYIEDVPIPRSAQIMKKKEGNIRALTNRALAALKRELKS